MKRSSHPRHLDVAFPRFLLLLYFLLLADQTEAQFRSRTQRLRYRGSGEQGAASVWFHFVDGLGLRVELWSSSSMVGFAFWFIGTGPELV